MTTVISQHRMGLLGDASPKVTVIGERCAGCQECVIRCPVEALSMDTGSWKAVADDTLCVGCRQCVRTCPFGAIEVDGPILVTERWEDEVHHPASLLGDTGELHPGILSSAEARAEAERCLACPDPTCVKGCPAHNDIPGFIAAIREDDLEGAQRILRRTSVLPDICSRVCNWSRQCEGACSWNLAGAEPVAIGALERFVADHHAVPGVQETTRAGQGLSVAVVGSGPAGIAVAWELLSAGAQVTMYEKDEEPLGVLRWGIPSFSLPDAVIARPIGALLAAGLELIAGREIGPGDLLELLATRDAVVLAHGAPVPLPLRFPGAELAGVEDATSFLSRAKAALSAGMSLPDLGVDSRLLVIGAGNTAMDVARSARRLGVTTVVAVDWMDRRFARVRADELAEAEEEGVTIRFLTSVARLEGSTSVSRLHEGGDQRVSRAHLIATRQNRAGDLPRAVNGPGESLEVDLVVAAMGYRNDDRFVPAGAPGAPWRPAGGVLADRAWIGSGIFDPSSGGVGDASWEREMALRRASYPFAPRVWVAGDALIGASTVVEAMAHGKRVGQAILAERSRGAR